jgi:hypothetical protein
MNIAAPVKHTQENIADIINGHAAARLEAKYLHGLRNASFSIVKIVREPSLLPPAIESEEASIVRGLWCNRFRGLEIEIRQDFRRARRRGFSMAATTEGAAKLKIILEEIKVARAELPPLAGYKADVVLKVTKTLDLMQAAAEKGCEDLAKAAAERKQAIGEARMLRGIEQKVRKIAGIQKAKKREEINKIVRNFERELKSILPDGAQVADAKKFMAGLAGGPSEDERLLAEETALGKLLRAHNAALREPREVIGLPAIYRNPPTALASKSWLPANISKAGTWISNNWAPLAIGAGAGAVTKIVFGTAAAALCAPTFAAVPVIALSSGIAANLARTTYRIRKNDPSIGWVHAFRMVDKKKSVRQGVAAVLTGGVFGYVAAELASHAHEFLQHFLPSSHAPTAPAASARAESTIIAPKLVKVITIVPDALAPQACAASIPCPPTMLEALSSSQEACAVSVPCSPTTLGKLAPPLEEAVLQAAPAAPVDPISAVKAFMELHKDDLAQSPRLTSLWENALQSGNTAREAAAIKEISAAWTHGDTTLRAAAGDLIAKGTDFIQGAQVTTRSALQLFRDHAFDLLHGKHGVEQNFDAARDYAEKAGRFGERFVRYIDKHHLAPT